MKKLGFQIAKAAVAFMIAFMFMGAIGDVRKAVTTDNNGDVVSTPITFSNQVSMVIPPTNANDVVRYSDLTNFVFTNVPPSAITNARNQAGAAGSVNTETNISSRIAAFFPILAGTGVGVTNNGSNIVINASGGGSSASAVTNADNTFLSTTTNRFLGYTALSNTLIQSVLNMGGNYITNLIAGVNALDAVNVTQLNAITNGLAGLSVPTNSQTALNSFTNVVNKAGAAASINIESNDNARSATFFPLLAGSNIGITNNGSNLVINASASAGTGASALTNQANTFLPIYTNTFLGDLLVSNLTFRLSPNFAGLKGTNAADGTASTDLATFNNVTNSVIPATNSISAWVKANFLMTNSSPTNAGTSFNWLTLTFATNTIQLNTNSTKIPSANTDYSNTATNAGAVPNWLNLTFSTNTVQLNTNGTKIPMLNTDYNKVPTNSGSYFNWLALNFTTNTISVETNATKIPLGNLPNGATIPTNSGAYFNWMALNTASNTVSLETNATKMPLGNLPNGATIHTNSGAYFSWLALNTASNTVSLETNSTKIPIGNLTASIETNLNLVGPGSTGYAYANTNNQGYISIPAASAGGGTVSTNDPNYLAMAMPNFGSTVVVWNAYSTNTVSPTVSVGQSCRIPSIRFRNDSAAGIVFDVLICDGITKQTNYLTGPYTLAASQTKIWYDLGLNSNGVVQVVGTNGLNMCLNYDIETSTVWSASSLLLTQSTTNQPILLTSPTTAKTKIYNVYIVGQQHLVGQAGVLFNLQHVSGTTTNKIENNYTLAPIQAYQLTDYYLGSNDVLNATGTNLTVFTLSGPRP